MGDTEVKASCTNQGSQNQVLPFVVLYWQMKKRERNKLFPKAVWNVMAFLFNLRFIHFDVEGIED